MALFSDKEVTEWRNKLSQLYQNLSDLVDQPLTQSLTESQEALGLGGQQFIRESSSLPDEQYLQIFDDKVATETLTGLSKTVARWNKSNLSKEMSQKPNQ